MSNPSTSLDLDTFGELLRHLRRRAGLTQRDLGQAVGYSETQITRLEKGQRLPDVTAVKGFFVEALDLKREPELANRLIELAKNARGEGSSAKREQLAPARTRARTNLPAQLTSFVGREHEIAEVKELLGSTRLLTLIGAGGVGKTRLAQEAAASLLDTSPDGVWYVELAALTDAALVLRAVASTLKLVEQPGRTPLDAIADYFEAKQALLILDNCEHLIAACADLAVHLLQRCPDLRILTTSRETLRILGEVVYRVPSLTTPPPACKATDLSDYESVRLFLERARVGQPGFELMPNNVAGVAQICRRLDGIPLALELAIARLTSLTLREIVERLDDCFGLLTTGARTALPRQQTLRATISWSVDLLTQAESDLLVRLSVFAGGFTAEAAEAIFDGPNTYDVLANLVDKSLVIADVRGEQARYRLLEPIRQYASEGLSEIYELECGLRHLRYFIRLAETAETHLMTSRQLETLNQLDTEYTNLRSAIEWAIVHNDCENGLRLASSLWLYWMARGNYDEGLSWLERLLTGSLDDANLIKVKALFGTAVLAWFARDIPRMASASERGLHLAKELQDEASIAWPLMMMGAVASVRNEHQSARDYCDQSLKLMQRSGNTWGAALASLWYGFATIFAGDNEHAAQLTAMSISLSRDVHDELLQSWALSNLSYIEANRGNYAYARACCEQSLELVRRIGDRGGISVELDHLGSAAMVQGDFEHARVFYEEALLLRCDLGQKRYIILSLESFVGLERSQGHDKRAIRLYGATQALREALKFELLSRERASYEGVVSSLRSRLGKGTFDEYLEEGRAMTLAEAVEYALDTSASPKVEHVEPTPSGL